METSDLRHRRAKLESLASIVQHYIGDHTLPLERGTAILGIIEETDRDYRIKLATVEDNATVQGVRQ